MPLWCAFCSKIIYSPSWNYVFIDRTSGFRRDIHDTMVELQAYSWNFSAIENYFGTSFTYIRWSKSEGSWMKERISMLYILDSSWYIWRSSYNIFFSKHMIYYRFWNEISNLKSVIGIYSIHFNTKWSFRHCFRAAWL